MKILTMLFLSAVLLLSTAAHADPVHYFELIDGDLGVPPASFVIGLGDNTIAGNLDSVNNNVDFDSFQFEVPAGLVVDHLSLLLLPTQTVGWMTAFRIGDAYQEVRFNPAASPLQPMFESLGAFKAGTYEVAHAYTSGNSYQVGASYAWIIHAVAAPLPRKHK